MAGDGGRGAVVPSAPKEAPKVELHTDSVKEFRVVMPLTVEEYEPGHLYVVAKMSRETREELGEGAVQVLANTPYFDDAHGGKGQYTRKRFHIGAKLPSWLAAVTPEKALWVEEEAWNSFPTCHTVLSSSYFTSLKIIVDTRVHDADAGTAENPHGLSSEELRYREIEYIDIASPREDAEADAATRKATKSPRKSHNGSSQKSSSSWWRSSSSSSSAAPSSSLPSGCVPPAAAQEEEEEVNEVNAPSKGSVHGDLSATDATAVDQTVPKPWTYRSVKAERGPLLPGWEKSAAAQGMPLMCVYKLVRVEPPYLPGLRSKLRSFIQSYFGSLFHTSHARVFTSLDDYYGLTLDQVRALELDSHQQLDAATLP